MKKKGVGQNKNFGPIQKLTVPDFTHIANVFEQMQSEMYDKPARARKQMKPFTIRKATVPTKGQPVRSGSQEAMSPQKYATAPGERERSMERRQRAVGSMDQIAHDEDLGDLTKEEAEALAPQNLKVVNPWIHEQTHQEYLKKITGLPARHANVISTHKQVVKETTFLPEDDNKFDKDKATREALAILDKEYEIFNDPHMQPVKSLPRYDTWDRDFTPKQWVEYCLKRPTEPHAVSPCFENGDYTWKPVQVLSYDEKERKFKVRQVHNNKEKTVTRLSLLFYAEDPERFKERVELCKLRQKHVEQELRFTDLVDSIPADAVSTLSKERREMFSSRAWNFIYNKFNQQATGFDPEKVSDQLKKLNQVVMEEYIRQMKKCIVIKEMQDPTNFAKFAKLKVPIRINKKTNPYFGVVRCPKYEFSAVQHEIEQRHWCSKKEVADMTMILAAKCIEFQVQRFMKTDKKELKLPLELEQLKEKQKIHTEQVRQNVKLQWREFLLGEMNKNLNSKYNFYQYEVLAMYEESPLKSILVRYEQILNTFLREFTQMSIEDWVNFIKNYTVPKYDKGELWPLQTEPMITIKLHIDKPKKSSKTKSKKKEGDPAAPAEDEDRKTIIYSPSLERCQDYLCSCIDQIVDANNEFQNLEAELIRFLHFEPKPNFQIPKDEEEIKKKELHWILDAKHQIAEMVKETMAGPMELLDQYKKYEFVLNISIKAFVESLFVNSSEEGDQQREQLYPSVSLDAIREQIERFYQAEVEILNVSNNQVEFPMFRVQADGLKKQLAEKAREIKRKLCERTYKWCMDSVRYISSTYSTMEKRIAKQPNDEAELVEIQEFIAVSKKETKQKLEDLLIAVTKHMGMLDDYSEKLEKEEDEKAAKIKPFCFEEDDIFEMYSLKSWPLRIDAAISDGQTEMDKKTEEFNQTLDSEKEQFKKNLIDYQDRFGKIKQFTDHNKIFEFNKLAVELYNNIDLAQRKVMNFNDRERLFKIKESEWGDLKELSDQFKPFYELIQTTHEVKQNLNEWKTQPLMNLDSYESIEEAVQRNYQTLTSLNKKLSENDYDDVAAVAMDVRGQLEEFRVNLPMIKLIKSDAITQEDWAYIKEAVGKPDLERDQVTVKSFGEESDNLLKYEKEIDDIVMRAEKKFVLTKKLKKLKEEMKAVEITTFRHEKANPPAWILKAYDEINTILDDQILQAQAMMGSSYMKGKLKNDTAGYASKLDMMSQIIDQMAKCQRTWMNLEPVFSSGDIEKTLPSETHKFRDVDKVWRETTDQINEDPGLMELTERENLLTQFTEANKKLDDIQRSLNQYLEAKSLVFPRFFFLDSESLLMLLAQTKDPRAVQPHMDKLFEGIARVKFTEREEVYAMISAEQEEVPFDPKDNVDVNEGNKKGNVEVWMVEIEKVMIKTLRQKTRDSNKDYTKQSLEDWVGKWPGQVVLAVDQINWTIGVEAAFEDKNIQGALKKCNDDIQKVVRMVRGQLPNMLRVTLKALVVLQVHSKTVVQSLLDQKVQDINDFQWSSQLRYYWEEDATGKGRDMLRVKMVTAIIDYGFEYLGNSPRLVITPLTDRCYRTLMGAKNLQYGGAPEGPAGTGKTETVKDLAKALAVQCVVFNCQDGLDHNAMAKFFKGLAASGAWCCFDEFNRIDLEVLSVIAQQILTIQNAIKARQKQFTFEGTILNLNPYCAVNITMNPGYAGRAELPDNLKALFRPCAMMVPNYALIAEIELYSFGFEKAQPIAIKVTASLTLSSEQLSSQQHYDFGMRALKAILTACGNLRRKLEDWEEDKLGLRALNDVNKPKFTQNDVDLYAGITADLFPNVVLPVPDYSTLTNAMLEQCALTNLQPKPIFLQKCIELYETICVRHGLMVVGGAFAGKSKVINTLSRSMAAIQGDPNFEHNVENYFINPKSILQEQLYGKFDADTGEWSDGVLAITIRDCAESETPDRKWIIFDGPVDAVWIENMNTVLDDNKKLCLSSGQIIKLKPTMTLMFEVEDLAEASPATVSRCGMVLLEAHSLGHSVLIDSYCKHLQKFIPEKVIFKLSELMHYCANIMCEFIRINCKQCVPTGPNFLVNNMINVLDTFVKGWDEEVEKKLSDDPEAPPVYKTPKEAEDILNNALLYAIIWGMGAQIEETSRNKFDKILMEMLQQENVIKTYGLDLEANNEPKKLPVKLPEHTSLFDLCYLPENLQWTNWLKTVPEYHVPTDCTYASLVVPTLDSIRVNNNLNRLLNAGKHTLIVGPTGTGKSISIVQELKSHFNNENYCFLSLAFSAQTSANQTQNIIDGKMVRRRKGHFGPPPGQQCIIFVDDLNMPRKEKYGAQPPIELLRQWMDYGGWYDIFGEKEFKHIQDVRFCAAMGPPGISGNPITNRYVRHYNIVYIEPYSAQSQHQIFSNVMDWMFGRETKVPWNTTVKNLKDTIVQATIETYKEIQKKFKPTPAKSHYTYNLRDVSKVFQGISKSEPRALTKDDDIIKLWAHECQRVFSDRLISQEDRDDFMVMLKQQVKQRFRKDYDKIVEVKPLLFASYVPTIYAETDVDKKKPLGDIYCELIDKDKMKKRSESMLEEFNNVNRAKKMDLVLFTDAIEHIVKIHRVITTQYGNALLVGVGGSGRKSLTELANFIANYDIVVLEMAKGYDFKAWRDDMREKLFLACGCDNKPLVFLFSDTQIINEAFLEDINNILNNGKIPNLYSKDDDNFIHESLKEAYKQEPEFKEIQDDFGKVFEIFERQARDSLHVVLAMSPIGDAFKVRLRMFPALVNCCTIDWFLPWPEDALQSVAEKFLKEVEDLPAREGIVKICVDMQSRAMAMTEKYRLELRRYYYVTPTSYLILIKTFTTMLGKRRKLVYDEIFKFDRGLTQLAKAESLVGTLRQELEKLIPELEVAAKESAEQQKIIEIEKKKVDAQKTIASKEAASAKEQKDAATLIKEDCEKAMNQVMPIYHAAIKAVKSLKAGDITELRGTKVPSAGMKVLAQVLCMFFNINAKIIKAQTAKDVDQKDYWEPCKQQLLTAALLQKLQDYPKDNVAEELVISVNPILNSADMSDEKMKQTSAACFGIASWCKAIVKYHEAMKIVKPKQIELKDAEEKSAAAKKALDEANENLAAVEAAFAELVRKLQEAQNKEAELKSKKENCEYKVQLADSLIGGLKGERENWIKLLAQRKNDREALVGDTIVCSGFLAYLGVFVASYRSDCVKEWSAMLQKFNISCTAGLDLVKVLGNPVKIAKWQKFGLPQDNFSTENAIIWKNSDRWTLCIDPQMQANKWLKNISEVKAGGKENVRVIKPTTEQKLMSRLIEASMSLGHIVIFEDANETFDPLLDPLLSKQLKKEGTDWMIKFGEGLKQYSLDFKLYITTKIARPHYSPEICVKVTMINFMVTPDGLLDQIGSVILRIEDNKKYNQKEKCISEKAEYEKQIKQKQDEILNLLANSKEDILEDKELKSALDESQIAMQAIEVAMANMEKTMKGIDASRKEFEPIALRVSRLFFVLTELINVNDMYQYSLDFFIGIFEKVLTDSKDPKQQALQEAEGLADKKIRYKWFISEFQKRLFKQVSWSLFENHKLLFAFLITIKVMDEVNVGGVNTSELRFMMAGSTKVQSTHPNPTGSGGWLSDKNWCAIEEMTELFPKSFAGFDKSFAENIKEWQKFYDHSAPQTIEKWPYTWQNNPMELIHKTMIMRVIRPDKVSQMITQLVLAQMGEYYVKPVAFDIHELYSFSNNNAPIILVISPGADPMSEIQKFSAATKIKVESISLGKGQDKKATDAIRASQNAKAERGSDGTWVVLQNCHLCPSFMPQLDALINEVKKNDDSSFRIWLTTMPSNQFPVTIVQNGLKATSEPPKGLKPNITKSFRTLVTDNEIKDCQQPTAFKKLVYGLCFFNAVILERRKFGALGWNVRYQFSVPDLDISKQQLFQFLNHYEDIPFPALNYMVAEANYGGRVTDPKDRRCIITILKDYYNAQLVNETNYRLSGSSHYIMPNVEEIYKRDDFVNYIENNLPFEDKTEIFGMHDNAEVTSAINFTNEFLAAALTQQPRSIAATGGKTPDQILDETATSILNKLPAPFDTEAASRKHPLKKEKSMNTVLQQEILRFNKLLNLVRGHLKQLKQAIKGEVVMSPDLEIISAALFDNKIPELWSKRSYPSMKPLASYIVDFAARLKFIQDWIDNDCPQVFWLSGFYFTQSFLTGLKQDFARKFIIAIDKIEFTFQVISDETKYDLTKSASDGAYVDGLFIEGCRWDEKMGVLAESLPKVLLTRMPKIWFKPQEVDPKTGMIDHGHIYTCPLYKTLERFGTLSTTGHSTNFVLDVMLPIQQKHPESHWIKRGVAMVTQDND